MPLADYQISVIDPATGELLIVYDGPSLYSMRYSRTLNGIGAVVLELPSEADLTSVFVLDAFIEVARRHPVTDILLPDETYLTRLTHRFRNGDEERFVAGGLSLNHLIARRVVDPDDDPAAAGGFSTKAGAADTVILDYADEQMVSNVNTLRRFPGLSINASLGVGRSVGARERYTSLIELFQNLAKRGEVDFVIERVTGTSLRLTVEPIGTDKTQTSNYPFGQFMMLNPLRGNLTNPSLEVDRREEATFVYAMGQGQGKSRKVLKVAGSGVSDSPFNRIEFVKDARNIDRSDTLGLLTEAQTMLLEKQPIRTFTYDSTGQEPGNVYHKDWELGDRLTVAWDEQSYDLRITGVEIQISEEGETMSVTTERVDNAT